ATPTRWSASNARCGMDRPAPASSKSRSNTPCRAGVTPDSPSLMTMTDLKTQIRHVPDFPKAGILFYDITTLLQDPAGLKAAIDSIALPFTDQRIDLVVGIESRGFIFGAPVADRLGAGFAPVRKP